MRRGGLRGRCVRLFQVSPDWDAELIENAVMRAARVRIATTDGNLTAAPLLPSVDWGGAGLVVGVDGVLGGEGTSEDGGATSWDGGRRRLRRSGDER